MIGPEEGLKDFSMAINNTSCLPLDRILEEGVDIKYMEGDSNIICMNDIKSHLNHKCRLFFSLHH